MFWLIMFVVGVVLLVLACTCFSSKDNLSEFSVGFGVTFSIIGGLVVFVMLIVGLSNYPYLSGKQEEIRVYHQRVSDVRNSTYKSSSKPTMISGSIENFKQSTILANYIKDLAKMEADYNKELVECKLYKSDFALWFFTDGFFISDKINDLHLIETKNFDWD